MAGGVRPCVAIPHRDYQGNDTPTPTSAKNAAIDGRNHARLRPGAQSDSEHRENRVTLSWTETAPFKPIKNLRPEIGGQSVVLRHVGVPTTESSRPKTIDLVSETLLRCARDTREVGPRVLLERQCDEREANKRPRQSRQSPFNPHCAASEQRATGKRRHAPMSEREIVAADGDAKHRAP